MGKIVIRQRSTAWPSLAWAMVIIAVCLVSALAGCKGDTEVPPPCPPSDGCTVPGLTPVYVPQCQDVDVPRQGPCVGNFAGTWLYVGPGSLWPAGTALELCPSEDGGPHLPCAWVPSVQGNGQGDSGAYVYGVGTVPGYTTGPVEWTWQDLRYRWR